MIRNNRLRAATLGFGLALLSTSVLAAPVVTVSSDPTAEEYQLTSSLAGVRSTFAENLSAVVEESFSSAPLGDLQVDSQLSLFGGAGSLSPVYNLLTDHRVFDNEIPGRFDTTCQLPDPPENCTKRWFESTGSFRINFGGAYNGFGFFGTDFGDFSGSLLIELIYADRTIELDAVEFPDSPLSGGVLFYQVLDIGESFIGVNVSVRQDPEGDGFDYFGFDDLVVGKVGGSSNPVPEPGSLALVGASLLALTAARRRRGRQA